MSVPVILAIETSQRAGAIAVQDGAGRVHVEALAEAKRHDDDLMPAVDRACARTGLAPGDLSAVGVSIGPGGFTGLRIAVTTAKMLALTLDVAIVAVPTALVVAERCPGDLVASGSILVTLAAKRETFWATVLERTDAGWRAVSNDVSAGSSEGGGGRLMGPDDPIPAGVTAVVGDRYLPDSMRDRCRAASIPVVEPSFDAAACLAVTARLLHAGETADPLALAPIYPRPPEAVSLWIERHGG